MTDYQESSDRYDKRKYDLREAHEDESNIPNQTNKDQKLNKYIKRLLIEKLRIDGNQYPYAYKYICKEINRAQQRLVKGPPKDTRYIDMYNDKPTTVAVKVLFPIKEHPHYNFIGKFGDPNSNTLKQLQEETKCSMNICGRGSMSDRQKEEELRQSLNPKYAHLSDELHIRISTVATAVEAHTRIASALKAVRKYIIPDKSNPPEQEKLMPRHEVIFEEASCSKEEVDKPMQERDPLYVKEPPPGRNKYSCKYPGCNTVYYTGCTDNFVNKHFFHLPKNPEYNRLWRDICNFPDNLKTVRICEDHFEIQHFVSMRRERLNPNAVPMAPMSLDRSKVPKEKVSNVSENIPLLQPSTASADLSAVTFSEKQNEEVLTDLDHSYSNVNDNESGISPKIRILEENLSSTMSIKLNRKRKKSINLDGLEKGTRIRVIDAKELQDVGYVKCECVM